ncbi:MAG: LemA family protein, partial [Acidobacteria bacterium]
MGRLLVLQEQYPQLKSNENFLKAQDEVAGTENRIATARKDY